ncbi:hypothetical protein PGQ11_001781 [Apiospora arundinis]|uniref:Uncharacterized protein n=1 Tax=Apiospora arundinis TaxID=335852 RepID=A0ABR2JHU5_9PEZI
MPPSAPGPTAPSTTRATYSSMAEKAEQGVQPSPPKNASPSAPASGGTSNNKASSSAPHHPQRRGGGGGGGYQKPPPSRHRHQHQQQHGPKKQGGEEEEEQVYVLTLLTDPAHERAMSALRRRWFPAHRLKVANAHMTLFHALPGRLLDTIKRDLAATATSMEGFEIEAGRGDVFRMGWKGVAVHVRGCEERVGKMRRGLIERWEVLGEREEEAGVDGADPVMFEQGEGKHHGASGGGEGKMEGVLSEQDARRGWKAHYTIMNKEEDREKVDECFDELRRGFETTRATVLGLRLWRYDRGWWRQEQDFVFGGENSQ